MKYKYQYVLNVLEDKLRQENTDLKLYNDNSNNRWGSVNIESCEHRIKELIDSITELKKFYNEK